LSATGAQAIVDWVLLELRNNDAGNTVAARRAALVRANGPGGESTTGDPQIAFNVQTVGKKLVIRHRNHLGAMANTRSPRMVRWSIFTVGSTSLLRDECTEGEWQLSMPLWPGDVNTDGTVLYTGTGTIGIVVLLSIGSVCAYEHGNRILAQRCEPGRR
jgi:hypothetical protein